MYIYDIANSSSRSSLMKERASEADAAAVGVGLVSASESSARAGKALRSGGSWQTDIVLRLKRSTSSMTSDLEIVRCLRRGRIV